MRMREELRAAGRTLDQAGNELAAGRGKSLCMLTTVHNRRVSDKGI